VVIDAWRGVIDAVNNRLADPILMLWVDSIVWQAGQVVDRHEGDESRARAALADNFDAVGVDEAAARVLPTQFTHAM
jgi:hypothetical protein